MAENAGLITKLRDFVDVNWVSSRIQYEYICLRGANTGSVAFTAPIFGREITLLRIVNAQNTLSGSSGSAVVNFLFGSGSTFTAIPGLNGRTINPTASNFSVSGNGQLITTAQQIRVEYVSFTSGPVDLCFSLEYRETPSL